MSFIEGEDRGQVALLHDLKHRAVEALGRHRDGPIYLGANWGRDCRDCWDTNG